MVIKQLSVFLENKKGRLAELTKLLASKSVDIRALCIADTTNFGILRMIVNNPQQAGETLSAEGFTVSLTQVIAIGIPDHPGGLSHALDILETNDISVEYMYAFTGRKSDTAYVIIRVEDTDRAIALLSAGGVTFLTNEEIGSGTME